ncbi:GGDEF domain-containing protein [Neptuniibacter sp. CAU 1671]|uniref:GGDEF domain-containing protein n=1 Tax=Neptuniibacter sp. CAU 1671 TaxID=3032593 RepID=UPI0023DCC67A|nr:GGDEF domain-containing protein [Neptuniibacter sp. CAU 1671]MDF2182847.1 GGDEF domain-containing protein [Neptuniibacter sp. CAU 1671]
MALTKMVFAYFSKLFLHRYFLISWVLLTSALLIANFYIYQRELQEVDHLAAAESRLIIRNVSVALGKRMRWPAKDVQFLGNHLTDIYQQKQAVGTRQQMIEELFLRLLQSRAGLYTQISLINPDGQEQVRAEFRAGQSAIVPASALENRANQYYVQEGLRLQPHELFLSGFDLDAEFGDLIRPYQPSVRFVARLNGAQNDLLGLVVIHYDGRDLFQRIESFGTNNIWLTTQDGGWLKGPDPAREWRFLFPESEKASMPQDYPGLWQKMSESRSETPQHLPQGLLTSTRFNPLERIASDTLPLRSEFSHWYVARFLPESELKAKHLPLQEHMTRILALTLVTSTLAALYIGLLWQQRRLATVELKKKNDTLALLNQHLEALASTDHLTQIANRQALEQELKRNIGLANRYQRPFSVILVDVDRFKLINDTQGHATGDTVLQDIANMLQDSTRLMDTVGRWGGEEFLIIVPEATLNEAVHLAEKLRALIESHEFIHHFPVTASFGVTQYVTQERETTLLARADDLLYQAKEGGRNRVLPELEQDS